MNILAIDPGLSGGFAWSMDNEIFCAPMPNCELEIIHFIRHRCIFPMRPDMVIMEQVGGFIPGKFTPGSRMFSFGENFGLIKGSLMTLGIVPQMISPRKWQNGLELGKKKDHDYRAIKSRGKNKGKSFIKNSWKHFLAEQAQDYFPQLKVTLSTADALLILQYQLRQ